MVYYLNDGYILDAVITTMTMKFFGANVVVSFLFRHGHFMPIDYEL